MVVHGGNQAWFGTNTGVVLVVAILLPLAALPTWALASRRRAGTDGASAWSTSLADVGMLCGSGPWVLMTLLPGSQAGIVAGRTSLVPLQDLPTMSQFQIVGNLLLFAALGFFAPFRSAALRSLPRVIALATGCSVTIEAAQYLLRLDRVTSVDDVLLNTAGAVLAALASRPWWPRNAGSSALRDGHRAVGRSRVRTA